MARYVGNIMSIYAGVLEIVIHDILIDSSSIHTMKRFMFGEIFTLKVICVFCVNKKNVIDFVQMKFYLKTISVKVVIWRWIAHKRHLWQRFCVESGDSFVTICRIVLLVCVCV